MEGLPPTLYRDFLAGACVALWTYHSQPHRLLL